MTDGVNIAIAPYSCIRSLDLAVESEVTQLSKLRAVMNAVVEKATLYKCIDYERIFFIRQFSKNDKKKLKIITVIKQFLGRKNKLKIQ